MTPSSLRPNSPQAQPSAAAQKMTELLLDHIHKEQPLLVKKRLAQGASPAAASLLTGETPLIAAAKSGSVEMVKLFLPHSNVAATTFSGVSALGALIPCINRRPHHDPNAQMELIRQLAPSCAAIVDNRGRTALMAALDGNFCEKYSPSILDLLRPHSDLEAQDSCGETACSLAVKFSRWSAAAAIFAALPDKSRACRSSLGGRGSLLHIAAEGNSVQLLELALPFSDVDAKDSEGKTPLMRAASAGSKDACLLLLSHGLGARAVDSCGCDALMHFIEGINFRASLHQELHWLPMAKCFTALVQASLLTSRDFLDESALDKARAKGLSRQEEFILVAKGSPAYSGPPEPVKLAATTPKLQTLLLDAISPTTAELVNRRLAQGADPRLPSPCGSTALIAPRSSTNFCRGAIISLKTSRARLPSWLSLNATCFPGPIFLTLRASSHPRPHSRFPTIAAERPSWPPSAPTAIWAKSWRLSELEATGMRRMPKECRLWHWR